MPIEIIGALSTQHVGEATVATPPLINPAYLAELARAQEQAGFDNALIGYFSFGPDPLHVATHTATLTPNLNLLVAHRAGVVQPTMAARSFVTADQFSGGRIRINVVSGSDDAEQQRDGDFLAHDERYERADEYLDALKKIWAAKAPIDYEGRFYRFKQYFLPIKPVNGSIPIYFSGSSDAAIRVSARHADLHMLWAEPVEQIREQVQRIKAAAAAQGRADKIRISLSVRPILGATEAEAWARANQFLAKVRALQTQTYSARMISAAKPSNTGGQRQLAATAQGRVLDKRLWTEIAALLAGKGGNAMALVGTAEQVAESLLDYYAAGVDAFLLRGFDPVVDAIDYGKQLIPLLRSEVARRDSNSLSTPLTTQTTATA